ncbi:exodeoxyribonuclease III [Rhodomicrobium lacus]|uniref:exodeoxyribonuclease III n=1 Tax=Rhodomicrobium lacus TaxID=2498452 RepID=UPI0026E2F0A0|nr:exodeoxyribonuclease III [Rhodomicrobium lacus]WKW52398.1 exodeoxyribonuclease III [Rhodomicrobium lacus]
MLTVATWNVNSIKQRETAAVQWLKRARPDVLCLQEIKCQTEAFPRGVFEDLGYNCAVIGQKSFNGVAILSRFPIDETVVGLPGDDTDEQSRYIEAVLSLPGGGAFRVASVYAPNGNPVASPKLDYKLAWLARFKDHAETLLAYEEPFALAGDYNIIPRGIDVYNPAAWTEDALFRLESRQAFRRILNLGLADAVETCNSGGGQFTFWDYQAGAWQKNLGLRIDHILLSPQALSRLRSATIDRTPRSWDKPSDHTPVQVTLGM